MKGQTTVQRRAEGFNHLRFSSHRITGTGHHASPKLTRPELRPTTFFTFVGGIHC